MNADNIFNSITQVGDEIIYLNHDDNDDDKNPSICSVGQLLENYIKVNNHLSFSTLLKVILSKDDDDNFIDNNIYLHFHKIFLPNYSTTNAVSII